MKEFLKELFGIIGGVALAFLSFVLLTWGLFWLVSSLPWPSGVQ